MKRPVPLCALLIAASMVACSNDQPASGLAREPTEAEEAAAAWTLYKRAALAKDGPGAVAVMSSETIAYYEEMKNLALTANKQALAGEGLVDRANVLIMRVNFSAAELRTLSASGLISAAIEKALIGEGGTVSAEIRSVKVAGDVATGDLVGSDGKVAGRAELRKQEGRWKVNLVPLIRSADLLLRQGIREQGLDEDEFILELVGAAAGRTIGEEVWDPPKD